MCEGLSKISTNFTSHLIKVGKLKRFKKVSSDLKTTLKTDLADLRFLGVILWVLRVLGQGLNQSARIFFTRVFSGCYAIRRAPKRAKQRLWLQSRSVLSSFGVVLMSCRVNFYVVRSALQYSSLFCLQNLIWLLLLHFSKTREL